MKQKWSKIINKSEAARIACVALSTIHRWAKDGHIIKYKVTGRKTFKVSSEEVLNYRHRK